MHSDIAETSRQCNRSGCFQGAALFRCCGQYCKGLDLLNKTKHCQNQPRLLPPSLCRPSMPCYGHNISVNVTEQTQEEPVYPRLLDLLLSLLTQACTGTGTFYCDIMPSLYGTSHHWLCYFHVRKSLAAATFITSSSAPSSCRHLPHPTDLCDIIM